MKRFKLTKGVQIMLITLFIVIIGAIIVGTLSKDEVMAESSVCDCGGTGYTFTYDNNGTGYHWENLYCASCGIILNSTVTVCTPGSWQPSANVSGTHAKYCIYCGHATETGTCYDNTGDGTCDVCGGDANGGGGGSNPGEECTCNGGSTSYDSDYRIKSDVLHSRYYICNTCGGEWYDADYVHNYTSYTDNGDGTHTSYCDQNCGASLTTPCSFLNGVCTKCGAEEPIEEIEITSPKYEIEGTYIYVQPSTKASEFKTNINTNAKEIKIYKNEEEVSDDTTITTGMTLELKNGELTKTFIIIVKGDVNSDGLADFKDIVKINKARLNKITLEEIYFLAANVNVDEILDLKDLSKINRFRLNKIIEL